MTNSFPMFEEVRSCICKALEMSDAEANAIDLNAAASNLAKWDSLSHLKIILALEKHFKVKFGDDEIIELVSMEAILKAIAAKK